MSNGYHAEGCGISMKLRGKTSCIHVTFYGKRRRTLCRVKEDGLRGCIISRLNEDGVRSCNIYGGLYVE